MVDAYESKDGEDGKTELKKAEVVSIFEDFLFAVFFVWHIYRHKQV